MRNFAGWIGLWIFTLMVSPTAGAAVKAAPPYTVTASAGSGGSVTPKGKVTVAAGSQQSFTIAPNAGYHVVAVKLDGVSKGVVATVSAPTDFTAHKTSSHKLAATFAINTCQVNIQAGSGGKVSIASKTVKYGTKLSFTVTPDKGYAITSMSVGAPDATGTTPVGSYSRGVFKGTLTVTSDIGFSVSFAQQPSGGGPGGASGFTSSMLAGKTVYLVNSDGYSIFAFNSKGTVNGSSSITSGTPVPNLTASWKLLSNGPLEVYSGTIWSYTYALAFDSGTYWDVVETDKTGAASAARMFYGSGALAAAQAYYLATYGGGNTGGSYFYGYALGVGESSAANLPISAFTGKTFYWSDKSSGSYGKYLFSSTSGTGTDTSILPAGAVKVFEWIADSLSNSYNDQNTILNIAFTNEPHIVIAKSASYYYVCSNVDFYAGQQPPSGCFRWYFDNNGAGEALARTYAGK